MRLSYILFKYQLIHMRNPPFRQMTGIENMFVLLMIDTQSGAPSIFSWSGHVIRSPTMAILTQFVSLHEQLDSALHKIAMTSHVYLHTV